MPIITARAQGLDADGNIAASAHKLVFDGPLLEVVVLPRDGVPAANAQRGFAIVDTGASQSCVDVEVAKAAAGPPSTQPSCPPLRIETIQFQ